MQREGGGVSGCGGAGIEGCSGNGERKREQDDGLPYDGPGQRILYVCYVTLHTHTQTHTHTHTQTHTLQGYVWMTLHSIGTLHKLRHLHIRSLTASFAADVFSF